MPGQHKVGADTLARQFDSQENFLKVYADKGSILGATKVMDLTRTTVYRWINGNLQGFKDRLEHAQHDFREYLQQIMFDRIKDPQGNRGSDVLVMFAIKGHWREKYGDAAIPMDSSALDLLSELRDLRKMGQTIEGEPAPLYEEDGQAKKPLQVVTSKEKTISTPDTTVTDTSKNP